MPESHLTAHPVPFIVPDQAAFGGLAVAVGLLTRLFAPMLAVQMAVICLALGPTYSWIDRGFEYPIILGFVALTITTHGGVWSVDRHIGWEL